MIGNPVDCPDIHQAIQYALKGRKATIVLLSPRILASLPADPASLSGARLVADYLAKNRVLRIRVPNPYRHLAISVPPGEDLGARWEAVVKYMLLAHGVDLSKHDYIAIQHQDRPHDHIHLFWCRIGLDGSLIRDRLGDGAVTQKVCRQMEVKYGLRRLQSSISELPGTVTSSGARKRKRPTRAEFEMTKRGVIPEKEQFRTRLTEAWPGPNEVISFEALTKTWMDCGIRIEVCRKGNRVGVVYEIDGQRKKASELGKQFQWQALSPHISTDITTGDIAAIRSIRPGKKRDNLAPMSERMPEQSAIPLAVPEPSQLRKKPLVEVNLLALMEDTYARFSAATREERRRRLSGLQAPRGGSPGPQDPRLRGRGGTPRHR